MDAGAGNLTKAERILDAARDILLRRGARGVVISDVAKLAQVGKGTVYLYWDTKEDLIAELFVRDFVGVLDDVIARLREAPEQVAPNRFFSLFQSTVRDHPFLTGIRMRDAELIGVVYGHPTIKALIASASLGGFLTEALPVLREHGLARTDLALEVQVYAGTAILEGFFALSSPYPWSMIRDVPTVDAEAVLDEVFQRLIGVPEPAASEAVASASAAILGVLQAMRDRMNPLIGDRVNKRTAA